MKYAGFWVRLGAGIVDAIITIPIGLIFIWLGGFSIQLAILGLIISSLFYPAYNIYFHGKYGQTIGKMVTGIKVVKVSGSDITFKEAFLRNSVDILFSLLWIVARVIALNKISETDYLQSSISQKLNILLDSTPSYLVWVSTVSEIWIWSEVVVLLFNKKKRAIHDYIAGTVVKHKEIMTIANKRMEPDA